MENFNTFKYFYEKKPWALGYKSYKNAVKNFLS